MRLLPLLALLLAPALATAQSSVYRTVDENGNVIFTDAPPAGSSTAERVELPLTNTTPPPANIAPAPGEKKEPAAKPLKVSITEPANETTIPMGPGNFSVSARLSGDDTSGKQLQLFMDGNPQGEPQAAGRWSLSNVFRGAHDLTVAAIDARGETVATSEPVRVYVLRPSINYPNRQ